MSIKRNIQCFREWAYSIKALKNEPIQGTVIDPTLNSKERNRLKWQKNRRPKEY